MLLPISLILGPIENNQIFLEMYFMEIIVVLLWVFFLFCFCFFDKNQWSYINILAFKSLKSIKYY